MMLVIAAMASGPRGLPWTPAESTFEFVKVALHQGEGWMIPGGVTHSVRALEKGAYAMDIFYPLQAFAEWFTFELLGLSPTSQLGQAVAFFVYDVPKILLLLTVIVFVVAIIRSIINDVGEVIPCNAVLQGEYGLNNVSLTVPCVLCKQGIDKIQQVPLNDEEKAGLERSARVLKPYMQYVEEKLGEEPVKSLA